MNPKISSSPRQNMRSSGFHSIATVIAFAFVHSAAGSINNCYNDTQCYRFSDCCTPQEYSPSSLLHCRDASTLGISDYSPVQPLHVWLSAKCPSYTLSDSLISQCEHDVFLDKIIEGHLPLMGLKSKILYKNSYCALCNGETDSSVRFPTVEIECSANGAEFEKLSSVVNESVYHGGKLPIGCKFKFVFPFPFTLRPCYMDLVAHCRNISASHDARNLCAGGPTFYTKTAECGVFRNTHCLDCNSDANCTIIQDTARTISFGLPSFGSLINFRVPLKRFNTDTVMVSNFNNVSTNDNNKTMNLSTKISFSKTTVWKVYEVSRTCIFALSALSLVVLLATYACVPLLRNRAGLLVCSHSGSLLITQLLQVAMSLSQNLTQPLCLALAFLTYFFLMSTFTWASLFGVDLLCTISSFSTSNRYSHSRNYILLTCGWSVSLVLVVTLIVLHFLPDVGPVLSRTSSICWFLKENKSFQLGFVFIPLSVVLIFNTVILLVLAYRLYSSFARAPTSSDRQKYRKLGAMTIKISTILGIAWLPYFVLVATGAGKVYLSVAELLITAHGFTLMLAFLANKRVRKRIALVTSSVFGSSSNSTESSDLSARRKSAGVVVQKPLLNRNIYQ